MITIRPVGPADLEPARRLLLANGWSGPHFEPDVFPRLVERATESLVALHGETVVGFARALGDGFHNGYVSMLVVDERHRRRGIARSLVEHLMGDDTDMTWVLRAGRPGLVGFYEKLGFRRSEVAMERVRR